MPADCATQLPSFMDSCDQFLQLGVNSGLLSTLQSARAGCPAPVPARLAGSRLADGAERRAAPAGRIAVEGARAVQLGVRRRVLPLLGHCSSYLLLPDNTDCTRRVDVDAVAWWPASREIAAKNKA